MQKLLQTLLEGFSAEDGAWLRGQRLRGDQVGIPCVFMRAGTSRGAFLREESLPRDPALREKLILGIYGSPDVRQIDGLGGATSLTSKVAIIGPSTHPQADVDYTFGQVRIDEARVDFRGNCGNISAGVAPYALEEGMVRAGDGDTTEVCIHLTNSGATLEASVPTRSGLCPASGEASIAGVPGTGAPIWLDWKAVGGTLGRGLLPTGKPKELLQTAIGDFAVSLVDAGNVTVFAAASDFGLSGPELIHSPMDADLLARLEVLRGAAARRLGMVERDEDAAGSSPTIPKMYLVAPPLAYADRLGRPVAAADIDLIARGLSMGVPHAAYAGTVAVCTAVAAKMEGTVVSEALGGALVRPRLRIGHPMGRMEVEITLEREAGGYALTRAAVMRTARRIMDGMVYVPLLRLR